VHSNISSIILKAGIAQTLVLESNNVLFSLADRLDTKWFH